MTSSTELPTVTYEILTDDATPPYRAHTADAGADLASRENVVIPAGGHKLVGTGIAIATPEGYVCLVHPRSGLAAKHGITVLNAPGTVDAGYTGELKVNLHNTSGEPYEVQVGDRIAQILFQRVELPAFVAGAVQSVETERGSNGYGSTGFGTNSASS